MANIRGSFSVEGTAQVLKALRELPSAIQGPALQAGIREGAKVVRDSARSLAPVDTGRLRRNIIITRVKAIGITDVAGFVMVRKLTQRQITKFKQRTKKAATENPQDAFYWRFLEFGTARLKARPFMRSGFDQSKEKAAGAVREGLRKAIDAAVKKLAK